MKLSLFSSRRYFIATLLSLAGAGVMASAQATPSRLLVLGDSLSAEYGLARGEGWVALLQQRLSERAAGGVEVVNASISGETTGGGRTRLPALLKQHRPTHVLIELGGNDALRGLPLPSTRQNLLTMIRASQAAGAKVLLVGMQMPPNYGRTYAEQFVQMYASLATETGAALVPFLLQGLSEAAEDTRRWFQADGIHPLATAQPRLLDNVWPTLAPWMGLR